jgi:aldehyde:ferredoxin oxidoreductase
VSGVFNKFSAIDLSTGSIDEKSVNPEYFKLYAGGSALAARLFLDDGGTEIAPMAPEGPLFIMTGPMVGTSFPGSSRFDVQPIPVDGYLGGGCIRRNFWGRFEEIWI